MALVRTVTVGIRDAGGKVHVVTHDVPEDWASGERDAMVEVAENERLRTRFAVDPASVVYAKIGEPRDPNPHIHFS